MSQTTAEIHDLISLSRQIGANPAYAQGAGGNTSVKLNEKLMAVKASGCVLKEMSVEKGISCVDYSYVRGILHDTIDESIFNQRVNSALLDHPGIARQRPSIETSLHAALTAKYVIHSHSVYANVITCAEDGKNMVQDALGHVTWVDYVTPGRDLVRAILQKIQKREDENIIFCANHGLIVTGDTADETLNCHEDVNQKIRGALRLPDFDLNVRLHDIKEMRAQVLFPDQIVYTLTDEFIQTPGAHETLAAYAYITATLKESGRKAAFIPAEKVKIIADMESEKYRQSLIKK